MAKTRDIMSVNSNFRTKQKSGHITMTSEIETSITNTNTTSNLIDLAARTPFDKLASMAVKTVAPKSQRVYANTYSTWQSWCENNGINPLDLMPDNVLAFLGDCDGTKATRQRHLYALRKLSQIMAAIDGVQARTVYELLKMVKHVPETDAAADAKERGKRALNPAECDAMLRVWSKYTDRLGRRNMALIAVLLFTGVRRSELVNIRWSDVNLSEGTIIIRHGKGDKSRTVAIMDGSDGVTFQALKAWKLAQATAGIHDRTYVFCSVSKAGKLAADEPTPDKTIDRVVKETAIKADLENPDKLSPHDFRRTHLTEFLTSGGQLADAQAQAGHANEATTLRYAQAVSANRRRESTRFRFGAVNVAKPMLETESDK